MIGTILTALVAGGLTVAAMRWATRAEREALEARTTEADLQEARLDQSWADYHDATARLNQHADRVYRLAEETEWRQRQQMSAHLELCRWRDRLMAWQRDQDAERGVAPLPLPVTTSGPMSAAELRDLSDELLHRAGLANHLVEVYGGEPGHYISDAMPEQLQDLVDHAQHAPVMHKDFIAALGVEDEDEQGPDTVVDEPTATNPDRPPPNPTVPQPTSPPKVSPLVIGRSVRQLMREAEERRLDALARSAEIPTLVGAR